jgi:DNA-binding response OmpR family regulator
MSAIHRSEADLYLKIATLEDENAFLRRQLALELDEDTKSKIGNALSLTPIEAALVGLLYTSGRTLSGAALAELIPAIHGHERQSFTFGQVYVCKVRRRLGKDVIANQWGRGYRLTDTGRAIVAKALGVTA